MDRLCKNRQSLHLRPDRRAGMETCYRRIPADCRSSSDKAGILESPEDTSGHVETDNFLALTIFPEQNEIDFYPVGIIAGYISGTNFPGEAIVGILNKL